MNHHSRGELSPSRQEYRAFTPVEMPRDTLDILVADLVDLKDAIRRHNATPDLQANIYSHALSDPDSGRLMSIELLQEPQNGKIHQFDTVFFGGYDNMPPVNLSYKPNLHLFEASVQYSANRHFIDPSSALNIIDKNSSLNLSPYFDANITEDSVWQIANLLRLTAQDANPETYTASERHTYFTNQGLDIEFITTEQNGHTVQHILDLHTRTMEQDGLVIMKALNFRSTIDSQTKPHTSLTTYEVTASGAAASQHDVDSLATLSSDDAHYMLTEAMLAMRPID